MTFFSWCFGIGQVKAQEERRARSRAWGSLRSLIQSCSSHSRIAPASSRTDLAHPSIIRKVGRRSFIISSGVIKEGAPILLKFVTQVAARFGLVVTQKVAAQALPVVGALGGAAVNYAFIEHFQEVARGHFTVRRLERLYGKDKIRTEYDQIAQQF
jgi:uncharacterized YccA/Bax inhibitor family protein